MGWSIESIIALVTLLVTCVPFGVLLWKVYKRRYSRQSLDHGGEPTNLFNSQTSSI